MGWLLLLFFLGAAIRTNLFLKLDGQYNPRKWRIWKWCLTGGVLWDFWHSCEACCPLRPQMHCTDCSARFLMRISCLMQASRSRSSRVPASTSSTGTCKCIWRPRTYVAVLAKRCSARSKTPPTPPPPSQVILKYFPLEPQSNGWILVVFGKTFHFRCMLGPSPSLSLMEFYGENYEVLILFRGLQQIWHPKL